ncbi:unnamed protein product [Cochlearia groenlandica]
MEKRGQKRRIVLVPTPGQGHLIPLMQLGKALQVNGFSITVIHGQSNQISSSYSQNFQDFDFITMPETLPEPQGKKLGPVESVMKLNQTVVTIFKDCIARLLLLKEVKEQSNDIACIIYDALMYFCEGVAKEFKIPCAIFCTTSATNQVCCRVLSKLNMEDLDMQDELIEGLHPLRYKDLPTWGFGSIESVLEVCREVANRRTSFAVINNTVNCLESSSLSWLKQDVGIPVYPLGPLHITTSSNSSLLEEDKSCIEWLNKQKPRSVLYISLGSKSHMETNEVLEMAWGLCNSNQPFLWVIREGSESLPEEVKKMVLERGYIVKWAPQVKVLGHHSVGGFWSHCGWNSTLESIVEGVPMICRPFQGEQKLNAMYIERVWRIGIRLEGEIERGMVERFVKRLIVDEEGESMREIAIGLKEKVKASVRIGGSSYNALDEIVKYLKKE